MDREHFLCPGCTIYSLWLIEIEKTKREKMRESIGKTVKTSVTEMLKTYKKSRLMGIDINLRFALY